MKRNKHEQGDDGEIIKDRSIRAASKRRTFTSALVIFLIIALLLTGTVWGTISFIDANSLRVYINRRNVGTISLSETMDFNSPTSVLRMKGPEEMNNTTYDWIEQRSAILGLDGDHHEKDLIGYSFYLRNMGDTDLLFSSKIVLNQLTRDVQNALRIIVIEQDVEDGVVAGDGGDYSQGVTAVCYAMTDFDGEAEYISYDTDVKEEQQPLPLDPEVQLDALLGTNLTTPFAGFVNEDDPDECVVFAETDAPLRAQEIKKYTLLVWVEGSDSDCTDAIINSFVNFEFEFEVTDEDAILA